MSTPTVQSVITAYQNHCRANNRRCPEKDSEVAHTFQVLCASFGSRPVEKMTAADLVEWIDGQARWKSASTRAGKCKLIKAAFTWAADHDMIPKNPFRKVSYDQGEPRRAMTWEEFRAILKVSPAPFRRFLFFLWWTGARAGEARTAAWSNLENGVITLQKHKTRKKTRKPREIVLIPKAQRLLQWMWENKDRPSTYPCHHCGERGCRLCGPKVKFHVKCEPCLFCKGTGKVHKHVAPKTDVLFCNSVGKPWDRRVLGARFRSLRAKAGVSEDAHLHGIRHALATNLIAKGRSIKLVSQALGHASVSTTERVYCHLAGRHEEIRAALL